MSAQAQAGSELSDTSLQMMDATIIVDKPISGDGESECGLDGRTFRLPQ
jgi:hypothetical protein